MATLMSLFCALTLFSIYALNMPDYTLSLLPPFLGSIYIDTPLALRSAAPKGICENVLLRVYSKCYLNLSYYFLTAVLFIYNFKYSYLAFLI